MGHLGFRMLHKGIQRVHTNRPKPTQSWGLIDARDTVWMLGGTNRHRPTAPVLRLTRAKVPPPGVFPEQITASAPSLAANTGQSWPGMSFDGTKFVGGNSPFHTSRQACPEREPLGQPNPTKILPFGFRAKGRVSFQQQTKVGSCPVIMNGDSGGGWAVLFAISTVTWKEIAS